MMAETMERTFYSKILDSLTSDVTDLEPEDFRPVPGTILCVLPPAKKESAGGIILPDGSVESSDLARVAAVPEDLDCPVEPGDGVLFQKGCNVHVPFGGRKDLILLSYCGDASSEIRGIIPWQIMVEKKIFDTEEEG